MKRIATLLAASALLWMLPMAAQAHWYDHLRFGINLGFVDGGWGYSAGGVYAGSHHHGHYGAYVSFPVSVSYCPPVPYRTVVVEPAYPVCPPPVYSPAYVYPSSGCGRPVVTYGGSCGYRPYSSPASVRVSATHGNGSYRCSYPARTISSPGVAYSGSTRHLGDTGTAHFGTHGRP